MGKKSGSPKGDTTSAEVRQESEQSPSPTADAVVAEAELKTVDEWRVKHFPIGRRGHNPDGWKHDVAEYKNRWLQHAHHHNDPKRVTEEQYLTAIKWATEPIPRAYPPALFKEETGGAD